MTTAKRIIGTLPYRALGAASLDRAVFEGIEHDSAATRQALLMVVASSLAAGFGASGWNGPHPATLIAVTLLALVSWFAWALLILQIGGRYLAAAETQVSLAELLRTTGFAASPGLLQVFGWIPGTTTAVFVLSWVWMLVAMTIAVQQALDFPSYRRALAVCGLALAAVLALAFVIAVLFSSTTH